MLLHRQTIPILLAQLRRVDVVAMASGMIEYLFVKQRRRALGLVCIDIHGGKIDRAARLGEFVRIRRQAVIRRIGMGRYE